MQSTIFRVSVDRKKSFNKIGQKNNGDCIGAIAITFMCHDDVSVLSAYRLNL